MLIKDKEEKGVYVLYTGLWAELWAFNKKQFPTKDDAVNKFLEITNNADIEDITEQYVRFCWWTETHGYEYPETETNCGYRTTDKTGRGAMDCWIIHQDMHWERLVDMDNL